MFNQRWGFTRIPTSVYTTSFVASLRLKFQSFIDGPLVANLAACGRQVTALGWEERKPFISRTLFSPSRPTQTDFFCRRPTQPRSHALPVAIAAVSDLKLIMLASGRPPLFEVKAAEERERVTCEILFRWSHEAQRFRLFIASFGSDLSFFMRLEMALVKLFDATYASSVER